MKLHLVCFVYVILGVHGTNSSEKTSDAVLSSCSNMLQYQRDGNEWFGLVQVQSPNATKTLKLELLLSLPGRLPSQYVGSVELYRTKEETTRNVNSNQLVQYKVRFPLQDVLPKLDQISVNGQVRCTEPPESAPLVTQIRLYCTLFLESPQHQLGHAEPQQLNITGLHYVDAPQRPVNSLTAEEICGTSKYDSELSLGNETSISQKWPWLVPIYVYKAVTGPSFQCGGTLVSARIVVTTASCFLTTNGTVTANDVLIGLGRHNIINWMESGAQLATVKDLVIHSDFMLIEGSKDADIAIAVLQDRVEFTDNIRPICLWEGDQSLEGVVGQVGTVAGWGGKGVNGVNSVMLLTPEPKSIKMPIVSDVDCLRSSESYRYITSQRTFCAGSRDGLGPCKRDEGSGMMLKVNNKWMLRGIVSFVLSDPNYTCNVNEFVVFTDAAKFVSWIISFL
ncbi:serine protease gd-like [Bradysia coprophila]|uniref:serine protease gd-like n=1 Tax=Bradysia coprophila TaxID=38358 RepID=UPI00187D900B|nr:serine protease gd-like [Bradysia coprophila]